MHRSVTSVLTMIAIDDQARPERRAAALGRLLVANTATRLEVITLEPYGDRRGMIRDRLRDRSGALVIMDVHGGGFLGDVLFDEDAEDILQHVPLPVMAIGPEATTPGSIDTLMVVTDEHTPLDPSLDLAAGWAASIGTVEVAVVQLRPPDTWPDAAHHDDGRAQAAITARGLNGVVQSIPTLEPWETIRDLDAARGEALTVVTTRRWPGSDHWFSTARALIRHAASPVIVIPHSPRERSEP